ncbi:Ig-like domain-containing protein, partial [Streptomyces sp. NPDC092307]|uniref:Ig-like domain-containing protein n=1 Tax=Streptomyces sp. NPDC092307 TaxID=3366013 RepID=UPI00382A6293
MKSTLTSLRVTPGETTFGEDVELTATVKGRGPGTPTGQVVFTADGVPTLVGTLTGDGIASVTTSALSVGLHRITATYAGDSDFTGSNRTSSVYVSRAQTTTRLTSSPDPSTAGQAVDITAVVTRKSPGEGEPTGTVYFAIGFGQLLVGTLARGRATVTTSSLNAGTHPIAATYRGDDSFLPSFDADTQTVRAKVSTKTTVVSFPDPSPFGQLVTLKATVAPTAPTSGMPTGTVAFAIGGVGGGALMGVLSEGVATVTTTALGVGSH